jgi:hypothetical protein
MMMAKTKSEFQKAVGKLISVIQKEWGDELGDSNAHFSEQVMESAHNILQAGSAEKAKELLGSLTVRQYLGDVWVQSHPAVMPAIMAVEDAL